MISEDKLKSWKDGREQFMEAKNAQISLYKKSCNFPTFHNNEEAKKFMAESKKGWSDKTKNEVDFSKPEQVLKYLGSIEAKDIADQGGREYATRVIMDAIHLPHQILSGGGEDNYHIQKLIGKGKIKAISELITQPHMQNWIVGTTNTVSDYDWDANWSLAFNMIDAGMGNREVKVINTYFKTVFKQLGWTDGIEFTAPGDDFFDVVKLNRWGGGYLVPWDLFNGAEAANMNAMINGLRVSNEEQKSNEAYTELLSYTGTSSGSTLATLVTAINTGAYLLKNRLQASDREVARATGDSLLLMYVNSSNIADRMLAALTAVSQAGATGIQEVVSHNIQMVKTLMISSTPDTTNPGALLVLPGYQLYAVSGMGLDIQSERAWENNAYKLGGQATWKCDNQNSNQITLVNNA